MHNVYLSLCLYTCIKIILQLDHKVAYTHHTRIYICVVIYVYVCIHMRIYRHAYYLCKRTYRISCVYIFCVFLVVKPLGRISKKLYAYITVCTYVYACRDKTCLIRTHIIRTHITRMHIIRMHIMRINIIRMHINKDAQNKDAYNED